MRKLSPGLIPVQRLLLKKVHIATALVLVVCLPLAFMFEDMLLRAIFALIPLIVAMLAYSKERFVDMTLRAIQPQTVDELASVASNAKYR